MRCSFYQTDGDSMAISPAKTVSRIGTEERRRVLSSSPTSGRASKSVGNLRKTDNSLRSVPKTDMTRSGAGSTSSTQRRSRRMPRRRHNLTPSSKDTGGRPNGPEGRKDPSTGASVSPKQNSKHPNPPLSSSGRAAEQPNGRSQPEEANNPLRAADAQAVDAQAGLQIGSEPEISSQRKEAASAPVAQHCLSGFDGVSQLDVDPSMSCRPAQIGALGSIPGQDPFSCGTRSICCASVWKVMYTDRGFAAEGRVQYSVPIPTSMEVAELELTAGIGLQFGHQPPSLPADDTQPPNHLESAQGGFKYYVHQWPAERLQSTKIQIAKLPEYGCVLVPCKRVSLNASWVVRNCEHSRILEWCMQAQS